MNYGNIGTSGVSSTHIGERFGQGDEIGSLVSELSYRITPVFSASPCIPEKTPSAQFAPPEPFVATCVRIQKLFSGLLYSDALTMML